MSELLTKNVLLKFSLDSKGVEDGANKSVSAMQPVSKVASQIEGQLERTFGVPIKSIKEFTAGVTTSSTAMAGATKSTGAWAKALRVFRIALISTGIGALVVILGSVITFLSRSEKGTTMWAQAMAGLGAIFDVITRVIANFGGAVVKTFSSVENFREALGRLGQFIVDQVVNRVKGLIDMLGALGRTLLNLVKLDFAGARDSAIEAGDAFLQMSTGLVDVRMKVLEASQALKLFGIELSAAAKLAGEIAKAERALELQQADNAIQQAELNKVIAKGLETVRDESKSLEERRKAMQQVEQATEDLLKSQEAEMEERLRIADLNVRATEDDMEAQRKAKLEEKALIAESITLQASAANQRRSLLRFERSLSAQEQKSIEDRAKAERDFNDAIEEILFERLQMQTTNNEQREIQQLEFDLKRRTREINEMKITEEQKAELIAETERNANDIREKIQTDAAKERLDREIQAEIRLAQARLQTLEANSDEYVNEQIRLLERQRDVVLESDELLNDERLAIEQEFQNRIDAIRENARQLQEQRDDEEIAALISKYDQATSALMDFTNSFNEIANNRIQEQIKSEQERLDKGIISQEQFDQKKIQLERKQALRAQAMASFEALINTFKNVASESNLLLKGVQLSLGLAQVAAINSEPLPSFKDGVIGFRGVGTGTSDSNVVRISDGESVIRERATRENREALQAINGGYFDDFIQKRAHDPRYSGASKERQRREKRQLKNRQTPGFNVANAEDIGRSVAKYIGSGGYSKR